MIFVFRNIKVKGKGEAVPEGSRRLRLPVFKTVGTLR